MHSSQLVTAVATVFFFFSAETYGGSNLNLKPHGRELVLLFSGKLFDGKATPPHVKPFSRQHSTPYFQRTTGHLPERWIYPLVLPVSKV